MSWTVPMCRRVPRRVSMVATTSRLLLTSCVACAVPVRTSQADAKRDTLSECYFVKHVGNAFVGKSLEIHARTPDGGSRVIGSMTDPEFRVSRVFGGSLSRLPRRGTETLFAISHDGRSLVFRSDAVGKGADRVEAGIHHCVCGAEDTLLIPERASGGLSYGAPAGLPDDVMLLKPKDALLNPHDETLALRADGSLMPLALLDAPPLLAAAYDGRIATIDSLMGAGASLAAENFLGMTATDVALWLGNEDAAIHLIERAPRDTAMLRDLLAVAIQFGRTRTIEALVRRGADVNSPTARRGGPMVALTPLMIAIEPPYPPQLGRFRWTGVSEGTRSLADSRACVERLIEAGADPNAGDTRGLTALHAIASLSQPWANTYSAGNLEIARVLIERGADPMRRSANGNSPLHDLVGGYNDLGYDGKIEELWGRDPYGQLLELFVTHTTDLEARNAAGLTAVQRAIGAKNFLAARYLVAHGASDEVLYNGHPVREILADELKNRQKSLLQMLQQDPYTRYHRFRLDFERHYGRPPRGEGGE